MVEGTHRWLTLVLIIAWLPLATACARTCKGCGGAHLVGTLPAGITAHQRPPYTAGTVIGREYAYELDDDCGFDTRIDGRVFLGARHDLAVPPAPVPNERPLHGMLTLTDRDHAKITVDGGTVFEFIDQRLWDGHTGCQYRLGG